jgi:hypothetical protein
MSARLEQYLKNRREELDVESPDDDRIWKAVKDRLEKKNKVYHLRAPGGWTRIRNIAAAIIILFSLGYIANDIINGRVRSTQITLSSINSDLGRRESEYRSLVGIRTKEVSSYTGTGNDIIKQCFEEIKELDAVYAQAMNDLKVMGPNEKVINTIFSTYEQKIRLLETIILETNKTNRHENNEKINL